LGADSRLGQQLAQRLCSHHLRPHLLCLPAGALPGTWWVCRCAAARLAAAGGCRRRHQQSAACRCSLTLQHRLILCCGRSQSCRRRRLPLFQLLASWLLLLLLLLPLLSLPLVLLLLLQVRLPLLLLPVILCLFLIIIHLHQHRHHRGISGGRRQPSCSG
jgi:hypothetical protein